MAELFCKEFVRKCCKFISASFFEYMQCPFCRRRYMLVGNQHVCSSFPFFRAIFFAILVAVLSCGVVNLISPLSDKIKTFTLVV